MGLNLIANLPHVTFVAVAMALDAFAVSEAIVDAPDASTCRAYEVVVADTLLVDAYTRMVAIVLASLYVAERSAPPRLAYTAVRDAMSMRTAVDITATPNWGKLLAMVSKERRVTDALPGSPVADPVVIASTAECCRGVFLRLHPNVG